MEKGKKSAEEKAAILARIEGTVALSSAAGCDLVIEAAVENLEIKKELFQKLSGDLPADRPFRQQYLVAADHPTGGRDRPARQIHRYALFNPVPVMRLVEIIRGLETSGEVYECIREASVRMGKEPVEMSDGPGFASNRVLMPMINEAIFCLNEGWAPPRRSTMS